jgi:hypothetical protein
VLGQRGVAVDDAAVGGFPRGPFVVVHGQRLLAVDQDGVGAGPGEALIGGLAGVNLDAVGGAPKKPAKPRASPCSKRLSFHESGPDIRNFQRRNPGHAWQRSFAP